MGHCQPNSKNIPCGCIHQQVISLRVEVYTPLGHFHIIGVSFVIHDALSSWLDLSEVRLGWLLTLKALFKGMTQGWSRQGPSPSWTNKLTQLIYAKQSSKCIVSMSMLSAIVLPWSTVLTHLCAISKVQSPSIYFSVWVIPVILFSAIIPKERVKSSLCWSVVSLKESKVPLKKENTVI